MFIKVELYRWMYDGRITGCNLMHNRGKCFLPVCRFQQFPLELSHQKSQTQDSDDLVSSKMAANVVCQEALRHSLYLRRIFRRKCHGTNLQEGIQPWILQLASRPYKTANLVDGTSSTADSLLKRGDRDLPQRSTKQ